MLIRTFLQFDGVSYPDPPQLSGANGEKQTFITDEGDFPFTVHYRTRNVSTLTTVTSRPSSAPLNPATPAFDPTPPRLYLCYDDNLPIDLPVFQYSRYRHLRASKNDIPPTPHKSIHAHGTRPPAARGKSRFFSANGKLHNARSPMRATAKHPVLRSASVPQGHLHHLEGLGWAAQEAAQKAVQAVPSPPDTLMLPSPLLKLSTKTNGCSHQKNPTDSAFTTPNTSPQPTPTPSPLRRRTPRYGRGGRGRHRIQLQV